MTARHTLVMAAMLLVGHTSTHGQTEPLPKEELRYLAATFGVMRSSFIQDVSSEEIIQAAMRGMVKELDPEGGQFLMAEDLADFRGTATERATTGVFTEVRDGVVTVVSPAVDSNAEKAGIRPKDVVLALDGKAIGADAPLANRMQKGEQGSALVLSIRRQGEASPLNFTVERQIPARSQVRIQMHTSQVALLRITSFKPETLDEIANKLAEQWRTQPFKGIVLDLRRNPGGLLNISVGIAAIFLPERSVIAELKGRSAGSNTFYYASAEHYVPTNGIDPLKIIPTAVRTLPLVVLVDEGTSAGAEMVAAALHDNGRARIVGRTTFGRTSIQTFTPLGPDRAVRYTSAYWYSPTHRQFDKVGIRPDRAVPEFDSKREIEIAVSDLGLGTAAGR